ncbi:MAG TPA: alpha-(1-_3)-arabinofuranosyltransferase family protein, partial [Acidimicrobiia bacterium]|nr:alpha-(1->3)-arabinofuranosyltransferase family protein [Acidimicrobiia bacterium]
MPGAPVVDSPVVDAPRARRGLDPRRRLVGWRDALLFGVLTFVPLSLGGHGRLNSDTWQYLYTDPVGLMDRARSLWDPSAGGGNVTHQGIGYLWPMGPYYWFTSAIGVPDWLAQRWWVAGIQFAAALGVLALLRHLLPRHPAQLVAAALYGLSPFVLGHVTGPSALLLPYAALGWMVLCVVRAVEDRGWRWPALFALIVTTCGSLNGSAVFFIIAGAVCWIPYAVWGSRTATLRTGLAVLLRLGALTLLTQLWWMVAYSVGGAHGLSLLAVTETVNTTSATTSAAEVLRGLGYWFFYARDSIGPWLPELAPPYTTVGLIAISFAVPIIALLYGAVARWGPRVYFAGLVVVGTVLSVGAFPNPRSPLGTAFEAASRSSDLVLSLRNTQRAVPLVVLGLAGLVAAGGAALQRRHARVGAVGLAVLAVFIAAALPAQWRSGLIADRFSRKDIPAAWEETAAYLDQEPTGRSDGRVLELPGIDFASYRWGHTFNPILGGLTDRPILEREIIPMGSRAGVSLLAALDRSLQEGTFEPASVAPVARLLGISDIVVRNDLRYERYGTARPTRVWEWLTDPAAKLGTPISFGGPYPNHAPSDHPMIDEVQLGIPVDAPVPPEVGVLKVPDGGEPIVSTIPAGGGLVVDGDGNGVVTAAAAGLLDGRDGPVLLAPELAVSGQFDAATGPATRYVVTDTDRKRAQRWYSLRENFGATEPANASITRVDDPSDARMDLAPGRAADSRTVAEYRGASSVWASSYGNDFVLLPEDRPVNAFDGDPRTAWLVDTGTPLGVDPRIGITLDHPSTADHLTLVQPQNRPGSRAAVRAEVVLDGTRTFDVAMTEEQARSPQGVDVQLDGKPFRTAEVRILDVAPDPGPVGFSEIAIPGVQVEEMIRLPQQLLDRLGKHDPSAPLALVLTRQRADAAEVVRQDPELSMRRTFTLDAPLEVGVTGTARLHAGAPDRLIDRAVGLPGAADGGWTAGATEQLAGSLAARPSSAFDGDP